MRKWTSVEEIATEFELFASPTDLEAVARELKEKRNNLHPDKFGGDFPSRDQQEEFYRLIDALQFINELKEKNLLVIPTASLSLLDERLINALAATQSQEMQITQSQSSVRDNFVREISARLQLPRVTSGAIGTIAIAIFGFWDNIANNPLLSSLSTNRAAGILWLFVFFTALFVFIFTYIVEQGMKSQLDMILSDNGLILILKRVVLNIDNTKVLDTNSDNARFSKRQLMDEIKLTNRTFRTLSRLVMSFYTITESTASECAQVILSKLEKYGVQAEKKVSFDEWYTIPEQLVNELKETKTIQKRGYDTSFLVIIMLIYLFVCTLAFTFSSIELQSTATSTITPSPSATNTATSTITPSPSATNTATSTITPSPSATNTATSTITPSPSATNAATSTITPSPSATNISFATTTGQNKTFPHI